MKAKCSVIEALSSLGVKEVCQKEKDINSRFDLEVTDSCRKNSFIRGVVRQKLQRVGTSCHGHWRE